jgi:hypothetical protein
MNLTALIAQREPPNAEFASYLLPVLAIVLLARSWWRQRNHPLFKSTKKPESDEGSKRPDPK